MAAYNALSRLASEPMSIKDACALYLLRKALEPQWEFQWEQELNAVQALGARVLEDGTVEFQRTEDRDEFARVLRELADLDVEWAGDKIRLDVSALKTPVSAAEVDVLAEFMDF